MCIWSMLYTQELCSWEAHLSGRPSVNKLMVFSSAPSQTCLRALLCSARRGGWGGGWLVGSVSSQPAQQHLCLPLSCTIERLSSSRAWHKSRPHGMHTEANACVSHRTVENTSELTVHLLQQGKEKKLKKGCVIIISINGSPFRLICEFTINTLLGFKTWQVTDELWRQSHMWPHWPCLVGVVHIYALWVESANTCCIMQYWQSVKWFIATLLHQLVIQQLWPSLSWSTDMN